MSPLMFRVCKDRKRKYFSLGISINPIHWDFTKGKPKPKCRNREQFEPLITEKTKVYSEKILELKSRMREFTAITLVEQVNNPTKQKTANHVFLEQLQAVLHIIIGVVVMCIIADGEEGKCPDALSFIVV